MIEESRSTVLTDDAGARPARRGRAALRPRRATATPGRSSSCTSRPEQLFAFLEVNTRLQVEHPVTELTTGLDLVKLQLHVARGGRLDGPPPPSLRPRHRGAAQRRGPRARLRARRPGTIELFALPTGPGVRVDTGVAEGDVIPPEYDSMIAKVIAWGRDRSEALARLARALLRDRRRAARAE